MLSAGTLAAGVWKYYDIATNSYSGNLATTNLPATINSDSNAVALGILRVERPQTERRIRQRRRDLGRRVRRDLEELHPGDGGEQRR